MRRVAKPEMRIVGVHPVDGVADCYLIESIITGARTQPDFGQITQPHRDRDRSDWQVPYDEKLLADDGESILADLFLTQVEDWPDQAQVSFFFHELDVERPLGTPYGDAAIPVPTLRPARLKMLVYEAP
jgi:hypothetical protein